jgi:membrane peptidoglycan carboxypeptidase
MNTLREAMAKTDVVELEAIADTLGRQAVEKALADDEARVEHLVEERQRQQREFEAKRQYHLTLRDATEVVRLQRERLGRKVGTTADAEAQQIIFEALRRILPQGDTSDPGISA